MQRLVWSLLTVLFFAFQTLKANSNDTLKVVNWNLEFFGDNASQLPQEMIKTRAIMDSLNADVYALVEVVNKDSLNSLVKSLNGDYDYLISSFGSFANNENDPDWASAQKLAIVYRKSVVRNVTGRAFMKTSSSAYDDWSSGRFPYLVSAEVVGKDSNWLPMKFIIIHAKAYSDNNSCTRRKNGAIEMKDSLDQYFPNERIIILGDYNDDLDTTICSHYTTSNYLNFVNDSSHYIALTLPLSLQGLNSINGYTSFIDHVIVSDDMLPYYVPASAELLKSKVMSWVTGYNSFVSDHYPVETKFIITNPNGIIPIVENQFKIYPNPADDQLFVELQENEHCSLSIFTFTGCKVFSSELLQKNNSISMENYLTGNYLLRIVNKQNNSVYTTIFSKK